MVILQTLWPDVSKNCLLHLLYHDVAEAEMGDVPATTKWNYPEINELMVHAEKNYEALIGVGEIVHQVTEEDKKKCDIADKLELVLHCYRLLKQGNLMGQDVLWNGLNYIESNYSKEPFYKPVGKLRRILWNQIKKDLQHNHRYC